MQDAEADLATVSHIYRAMELARSLDADCDDNRDDSCPLNDGGYSVNSALLCLVTRSAYSWQCGDQGSSPLSSTHFHRRLSATEPIDDASAMRPLSDVGEPAVGLYLHRAHLVRSRRIRHFMPTTGIPAPQDPHETADRRHPGGDHRRPHQYPRQPHAPLNSDDPLLRVPKSGQLVHAHRDAHDRLGENALHGVQCRQWSL